MKGGDKQVNSLSWTDLSWLVCTISSETKEHLCVGKQRSGFSVTLYCPQCPVSDGQVTGVAKESTRLHFMLAEGQQDLSQFIFLKPRINSKIRGKGRESGFNLTTGASFPSSSWLICLQSVSGKPCDLPSLP